MRRFVVYFGRRSSPSDRVHASVVDMIRGGEENLEPKTTIVSGLKLRRSSQSQSSQSLSRSRSMLRMSAGVASAKEKDECQAQRAAVARSRIEGRGLSLLGRGRIGEARDNGEKR